MASTLRSNVRKGSRAACLRLPLSQPSLHTRPLAPPTRSLPLATSLAFDAIFRLSLTLFRLRALSYSFARSRTNQNANLSEDKAEEDKTEDEKELELHAKYDAEAMKYLSYALYPLIVAYAVYSLVYDTHKSWYSFILSTLTGCVYTFGFIS